MAELQSLVHDWHRRGRPWVPSGLGTRLGWGAPLQTQAAGEPIPTLSTRNLNQILDHAVDDLTVTVQAGLPLATLQAALMDHNQWLPVDWPWGSDPSRSDCAGSIGGLVARGLSGGLRQRHMGLRDQIIGIGLIRSDGISANAGGRVVKNVAGYDLMRLLCGSWGSLALIHTLTLRTQPIRPARAQLLVQGDLEALEAWRADVLASTLTPEWINWQGAPDQGWSIRVGVASVSDVAVDAQLNRLEALAAPQRLCAERHPWTSPLPTPIPSQLPAEGASAEPGWLLRLALPPARISELLASQELRSLRGWGGELAAGAGSGELWQCAEQPLAANHQVQALRRKLSTLGGQLSVLLQPDAGNAKLALPAWLDAPSKPLIEAVKREFDPLQQLSRGRLPGVAQPFLS